MLDDLAVLIDLHLAARHDGAGDAGGHRPEPEAAEKEREREKP
jgi:hypothetical protein